MQGSRACSALLVLAGAVAAVRNATVPDTSRLTFRMPASDGDGSATCEIIWDDADLRHTCDVTLQTGHSLAGKLYTTQRQINATIAAIGDLQRMQSALQDEVGVLRSNRTRNWQAEIDQLERDYQAADQQLEYDIANIGLAGGISLTAGPEGQRGLRGDDGPRGDRGPVGAKGPRGQHGTPGLLCPAGTQHDPKDLNNCLDCLEGHHTASKGRLQCDPCPAGRFQNLAGQSACHTCGNDTTYSTRGAQSCSDCPAGSYTGGGTEETRQYCDECPTGFACPGGSTRTRCLPGHYADGGESQCHPCGADDKYEMGVTADAQAQCETCRTASFTSGGTKNTRTKCTICPAGYACDGTSKTPDHMCPAGKYSEKGKTTCSDCGTTASTGPKAIGGPPDKKYSDAAGSGACKTCPAGSYTDTDSNIYTDSNNFNTRTSCKSCKKGYACDGASLRDTIKCGVGKYASGGASDCSDQTQCGTGRYNDAYGSTHVNTAHDPTMEGQCLNCPPGFFNADTQPGFGNCEPWIQCNTNAGFFQTGAHEAFQGVCSRHCNGAWTSWGSCECPSKKRTRAYHQNPPRSNEGNDCDFADGTQQQEDCNRNCGPSTCDEGYGFVPAETTCDSYSCATTNSYCYACPSGQYTSGRDHTQPCAEQTKCGVNQYNPDGSDGFDGSPVPGQCADCPAGKYQDEKDHLKACKVSRDCSCNWGDWGDCGCNQERTRSCSKDRIEKLGDGDDCPADETGSCSRDCDGPDGCFPAHATVERLVQPHWPAGPAPPARPHEAQTQRVPITELQVGDEVMTRDARTGTKVPTTVVAWQHFEPAHMYQTVELETNSGARVSMSLDHMVAVADGASAPCTAAWGLGVMPECRSAPAIRFVAASDVRVGHELLGTGVVNSTRTSNAPPGGAYSPMTEAGTLLVDGVLASNYVKAVSPGRRHIGHDRWHAMYAPVRWLYGMSPALARYFSPTRDAAAEKRGVVIGNPHMHYYTRVLTGVSCRLAEMLPHVPFLPQLHEAYHAWLHQSNSTLSLASADAAARPRFQQWHDAVCSTW